MTVTVIDDEVMIGYLKNAPDLVEIDSIVAHAKNFVGTKHWRERQAKDKSYSRIC